MTLVDLPTVAEAGARVPLSRVHRPAATEDRERRRRRGAARDGSVPAHRADDEHAERTDSVERIGLAAADAPGRRSLTGSFTIDKQGFYRIELEGPHGEHVMASPQYTIDVTADRRADRVVLKPGRDTMATAVEELFVEAKASDDFGVKQLELVYAVNGGKEKTVKLFGGAKALAEVSAGHTDLSRGARASPRATRCPTTRKRDRQRYGAERKTVSSDIYFVQIRPYRKDFKPAQSQAQRAAAAVAAATTSASCRSSRKRSSPRPST